VFKQAAHIDFMIIGAQKCGTTSLHMYLRDHPKIFMPLQKETEFFSYKDNFERGRELYLNNYFSGAEDKICGEASPHYMYFTSVPEKIFSMFPNIKLIAILRNPVERCYSHYSMLARQGFEKRSFSEAIKELSKIKIDFPVERKTESPLKENNFYLAFGLYGNILKHYLKFFTKEKILLLFTEELESEPKKVLKNVFEFLHVKSSYVPRNIEKKYHVGGEKRFPWLEEILLERRIVRQVIRLLTITENNYNAFKFWLRQSNIIPVQKKEINRKERDYLRSFYLEDVRLLEDNFSVKVPWEDFRI
jgi:hypothetical protein